jgi:hypothetical protein
VHSVVRRDGAVIREMVTSVVDWGRPDAMPTYEIKWNDERGDQSLEADQVVYEDGIYEFWRGDDAFLRVPKADINTISPDPAS